VTGGILAVEAGAALGIFASRRHARIEISIPKQSLALFENGRELRRYSSRLRVTVRASSRGFLHPEGEHIVARKSAQSSRRHRVWRRADREIWTPD